MDKATKCDTVCPVCSGAAWVDLVTPCGTCGGTGRRRDAPPPPRRLVPPRTPARRRGLLALMVSPVERRQFRTAAKSVGLGVTVWARLVLVAAAKRRARPPEAPSVSQVGGGEGAGRGRARAPTEHRRDKQLRIGLTVDERKALDRAAKAAGMLPSTWSRAVLHALLAPDEVQP